jgi:enamine deaminase RidA (YjgF/YER057c/UK114 family)
MSDTAIATGSQVRKRLAERGIEVPEPWRLALDIKIPATLVRVVGNRGFVSGHVPTDTNGDVLQTFGKVGTDVDLATAKDAAIRTLLNVLASTEKAIGDLDRIGSWCKLYCMVNAADGFVDFPAIFNPASELLLHAFGDEIGSHARVAVGVAGLPWNVPVEIEAEFELRTE